MTPNTHAALEDSIAHWQRLYSIISDPHLDTTERKRKASIEGYYSDDCPLCALFLSDETLDGDGCSTCDDCPVAEHSGQNLCDGTPWDDARGALELGQQHREGQVLAEVDFLKRLLRSTASESVSDTPSDLET